MDERIGYAIMLICSMTDEQIKNGLEIFEKEYEKHIESKKLSAWL